MFKLITPLFLIEVDNNFIVYRYLVASLVTCHCRYDRKPLSGTS